MQRVREAMNLTQQQTISLLSDMDEYEFEELVADLWEQRGWNTTVTSGSGDRGIDVIAEKNDPFHQKHLIQAKRYDPDNRIGSPDVQQYSSLRQQEDNVDAVVIVTTSSFTRQAKQTAADLNVKLISGTDLVTQIREHGGRELLERYVDLPSSWSSEGDESSPETLSYELETDSGDTTVNEAVVDDSPGTEATSDTHEDFPYSIPAHVYHSESWDRVKLAFKLPIYAFVLYVIGYAARTALGGSIGEPGFETTPVITILALLVMISLGVGLVMFLVYVSRDKKRINGETGYARPRHPITIGVFLYFSAGMYAFYYLLVRIGKYTASDE